MEKLCLILLLYSIVLSAVPVAHGNGPHIIGNRPNEMKTWFRELPQLKQKLTELHFYLHDIVTGPKPTNIPVVISNFTTQSPTNFGLIAAMDDLLTTGSSPSSSIMGRAQGLVGSTSLADIGYHMTFDIVFTSGDYNGSTLSLIGHNPFMNEFRELPIVGGSGFFRLARGSALLSNFVFNETTGNAIVEYNIVVLHY